MCRRIRTQKPVAGKQTNMSTQTVTPRALPSLNVGLVIDCHNSVLDSSEAMKLRYMQMFADVNASMACGRTSNCGTRAFHFCRRPSGYILRVEKHGGHKGGKCLTEDEGWPAAGRFAAF